MVPRVFRRLVYVLRQRQMDADLAEELDLHREMKQAELERSGLPPHEARFASQRVLGSPTLSREDARAVWIWRWLDDLWRDIAHATRRIRANPGFSATAILTLAIVIGANSAMFSAVYAVLLRPFAIHEPDDLVICWGSDPRRNFPLVELTYRNFEDWATHSRSFAQVAAVGSSTWPAVLDESGESTRVSTAGVSVSFFQTMGVLPMLGRDFRAEDNQPMVPRVVILSYGMWVRRFGADPRAIGQPLQLDDDLHTIVGVMPQGFDFPRGTDLWSPVVPILVKDWGIDALEQVGALFVIGRLRGAVTPTLAAEELDRLADSLEQRTSHPRSGSRMVVMPFLDYVLGPVRLGLWALLAAVGVLLLVGCANLSGFMLTRVSSRRHEHAVLVALGATRSALARRWMMETLILSLVGGVVGLLASVWMARAMVALAPEVPRLADLTINVPVIAFTFGVMLVATLLSAAAPIRSVSPRNLNAALKESARFTHSKQTHYTQSLLVTGQVALSVILLVAAGLIMRSFVNLRSIDVGFLPSNVLTMTIEPRNLSGTAANVWMQDLLDRVAAVPGVEATGAVYLRPLALGPIGQETFVVLEGQQDAPDAAAQKNPQLNYQVATPGYFSAMRMQLREGRLFTDDDTVRSPRVAIVSETTARRLWPRENPIGKRVSMPTFDKPGTEWRTVVGVVNDVHYRGLDNVRLDVYDAAAQSPMVTKDLMIRTSGDPLDVLAAVRADIHRFDPRAVVDRVTTMDTIISQAIAPWRLSVWIFSAFAAIAVVLVIVGLFSTVSLDLGQRQKEFAVRMALGAQHGDIIRPVILMASRRSTLGVALGVLAALVVTRGLSSMLFGVDALDIATYGAVVALVLVTVVLASWLPASRAAKVDPMVALRSE